MNCPNCHSAAVVSVSVCLTCKGSGSYADSGDCPTCDGSGQGDASSKTCLKCNCIWHPENLGTNLSPRGETLQNDTNDQRTMNEISDQELTLQHVLEHAQQKGQACRMVFNPTATVYCGLEVLA